MKGLKIAVLLGVTFAMLRAASWLPALLLARFTQLSLRRIAVIANAAAFAVFAILLQVRLSPGEPPEYEAMLFGLAVFAVFAVLDCRSRSPWWARWRKPAEPDAAAAAR